MTICGTGFAMEPYPKRSLGRAFQLKSRDVEVLALPRVKVEATPSLVAREGIDGVVAKLRRVGRWFGSYESERVVRLDLAVDVVDMAITSSDLRHFAGHGAKSHTVKTSAGVQTIYFGRHQPLEIAIYDRLAKLSVMNDVEHREAELVALRARGLRDGERCTRVEARWTDKALTEYGLRNADRLGDRLDGIWQAAIRSKRLLAPGSPRRADREVLDRRWAVLSRATFVRSGIGPAVRSPSMGTASLASAIGMLCAACADRGFGREEAERAIGELLWRLRAREELAKLSNRIASAYARRGRGQENGDGVEVGSEASGS